MADAAEARLKRVVGLSAQQFARSDVRQFMRR
jgi:hypothetical protein